MRLLRYLCIIAATVTVAACARSAQDCELDRVFAHQARARDTTGTIVGQVADAATGLPIRGVMLSANRIVGISDSFGRFEIPYQAAGVTTILAELPGYQTASEPTTVRARESVSALLLLHRASMPCCPLTGKWAITFQLDSPGIDQHPTAREVVGSIDLSEEVPGFSLWNSPPAARDSFVHSAYGIYAADFSPFWGRQIAKDVSASVFGPVSSTFAIEAQGSIFDADSISIDLIPRISHGGISLAGRLKRDTVVGLWHQRAYCCGAHGHFTMHRLSGDPGPLPAFDFEDPAEPETLAVSERADVTVRIWDESSGQYIAGEHSLHQPDGSIKSVYTTASTPDGWGASFWVAPGSYRIVVDRIPCGTEWLFAKKAVEVPFTARAGEPVAVTVTLALRRIALRRSYNNTEGKLCAIPYAP